VVERGLLLGEEIDELLLGAQQPDLVFLELRLQRGAGEVGVADAGLHLVEELDEVGLGAGDGDAVLLR
jgi:hypothetical protein